MQTSTTTPMDTPKTPPASQSSFTYHPKRKYTPQEKEQLLRNLDIEVEHRTRQFERSLTDILENFRAHHEGQILRVPPVVRSVTMAEFGDKYNGNVAECLRGLQIQKYGGQPVAIDASTRKRKWQESKEAINDENGPSRASKNARLQSPLKKAPPSARQTRSARSPINSKTPSRSPLKKLSVRIADSPTKKAQPSHTPHSFKPPSSAFQPILPKMTTYPRPPRKNESLLSINGSPLMFPPSYTFDESQMSLGQPPSRSRPDGNHSNSINVRRDPSFMSSSSQETQRDGSQYGSQPQNTLQIKYSDSNGSLPQSSSFQASQRSLSAKPSISAVIRVPTKDGHILEFDPLLTSPSKLDSIEGITDSAKKQAKEDMFRLVQSALTKWKIS